ncbi:MAG: polysaccharide deacetylase [Bacteroidota bacterium]|jgi:peptidoglycan/xylan/chitin deacetylase (PgdA/CDA1 family)|nr:polysaccharide deacetylase [Bacteroidota bacterium]
MSLKVSIYRQKEKVKRSLSRALHGHCVVLLYHRIIDMKYDPQGLCVSADNFSEQLSFLKKRHIFISIEEFCDCLEKKKFPKNALLVTFDDGYADNYFNALPVLESTNVKGMFYVATENIGTKKLFWWDELDLIFKQVKKYGIDLSTLRNMHGTSDNRYLYEFYVKNCKSASSLLQREELLKELRSQVTINDTEKGNYSFLTKEELKALHRSKWTDIGAHTVNHLSLGHLNVTDQFIEISESVNTLSQLLGYKVEHFSFPYGERVNFNNDTIRICKQLNLKSAAANYSGYVSSNSDVFSFPRFVVRNDRPEVLQNKLKEIL